MTEQVREQKQAEADENGHDHEDHLLAPLGVVEHATQRNSWAEVRGGSMLKNRHIAGTVLFAGGCVWMWNLVPNNMRPSIPSGPFHKTEQTVSVDVQSPTDRTVPNIHSVRVACEVPTWLHWMEGKPHTVHVLFQYRGAVVGDTTAQCSEFL